MEKGPFKNKIEQDTDGVVLQVFTTYKLVKGVMTMETTTRRFKSGGDYHDSTEQMPLGCMFPYNIENTSDGPEKKSTLGLI